MNVRISKEVKKKTHNHVESVAKVMQQILLRENELRRVQEHFWIVGFNPAMNIVIIELIALGAHNRVDILPVDVFRLTVTKNATKAILVHNHPSKRLKPSESDKSTTNRLLKAGEMLGVKVLDHLIISETEYFSFDLAGIMVELNASIEWRVVNQESAEAIKFRKEMDQAAGALNKSVLIAKKLKEEGLSDQKISKITGLRLAQVRKL